MFWQTLPACVSSHRTKSGFISNITLPPLPSPSLNCSPALSQSGLHVSCQLYSPTGLLHILGQDPYAIFQGSSPKPWLPLSLRSRILSPYWSTIGPSHSLKSTSFRRQQVPLECVHSPHERPPHDACPPLPHVRGICFSADEFFVGMNYIVVPIQDPILEVPIQDLPPGEIFKECCLNE